MNYSRLIENYPNTNRVLLYLYVHVQLIGKYVTLNEFASMDIN